MKASKLLMLSLVSLTMLVGCGGDQPNPDPTPEEPTNETQAHKISIGETDGATVTPSKTSAESGEEITLTIVVPKGKEVDKVTSSVDANNECTYAYKIFLSDGVYAIGTQTATVALSDIDTDDVKVLQTGS